MEDRFSIEFRDMKDIINSIFQLLLDNKATLKLLVDLQVEEKARQEVLDNLPEDEYREALMRKKAEVEKNIQELVRQNKLEELIKLSLSK